MFGIKCTGLYLPWYLMGFSLLMGQSIVPHIIAVIVGHIFYYTSQVRACVRVCVLVCVCACVRLRACVGGSQGVTGRLSEWVASVSELSAASLCRSSLYG
jgi:hypothetical protein